MPMTREEHLFTILSEECLEVSHRIHKLQRFGKHQVEPGQALTNEQRVVREYADVLAVMQMLLNEQGITDYSGVIMENMIDTKISKVEEFLLLTKNGTLSEGQ